MKHCVRKKTVEKLWKSSLQESVLGLNMAKSRRRRRHNRQIWQNKSIFWPSVFWPFFREPKKLEKVRNIAKIPVPLGRTTVRAGPAERGERANLSGYGR